ncbi:hypothetical protein ACQ86N_24520 [Puia sp. P3]|uniref:hypothetical protein n=1 Tax=Puia sp. P3 TaxID=3423952 RepID=UPI003D676082
MKVLCFFLLMAGFVVCEGQGLDGRRAGEGERIEGVGMRPGVGVLVQRVGFDSIRVMKPDRMGCLVPGMGRVERMPVRRMYNGDRMAVRKGD